jgi:hypothetical protein
MWIRSRGSTVETTSSRNGGLAAVLAGLLAGLVLLLGASRLAAQEAAQETAEVQLPQLMVGGPPELAGLALEVGALRERLRWPMELTGLTDPGLPIRVVLAPASSEHARSQPAWVSGFADPPAGLVVLIHGRFGRYPDHDLESLLQHEVTHVLTHRAAGGRWVPRWFSEGLAMAASRESDLGDHARVALAMLSDEAWSLTRVEHSFENRNASPTSAYALSQDFVRHLMKRHGRDVGARILARMAQGESFPIAFRVATGERIDEAEAVWARRSWWDRWIPVIGSSTLVWIGISLLALAAFVRRSQRDAETRAGWVEHEATQSHSATADAGGDDGEAGQLDEPALDESERDEERLDDEERLVN